MKKVISVLLALAMALSLAACGSAILSKRIDKTVSLSAKVGRSRFLRSEAVSSTARGRKNS